MKIERVKVKTNLTDKFNRQKTKSINPKTKQNFGTYTNPLVLDSKFYPIKFNDIANANKIRLQNAINLRKFILSKPNFNKKENKIKLFELLHKSYADEVKAIDKGLSVSDYSKIGSSKNEIIASEKLLQKVLDNERGVSFKSHENLNKTNNISFKGRELTSSQKSDCHKIIHWSSAVCAGISAAFGEANITGADVPFLCAAEMMMFNLLTDALDADPTAALIHAGKHMASAGVVGMKILNKAISAFGLVGHIASALTTGGVGNIGVSAALRAGNGALSAGCCEIMGWAFVKDYKNGKMNVEDKLYEVLGYLAFTKISNLVDNVFDIESTTFDLQESTGKSLGKELVRNMPKGMGEFLQETTKKVADSGLAPFAEKALELTIPRVTQKLIETKGEVSSEEIENIIIGSALGVVCSDILGDTSYLSKETIQKKAIPIMKTLKGNSAITSIVNDALIKHGIKRYGDITLNRDMANLLEEFYNSVIPKIKDTYKTIKNL